MKIQLVYFIISVLVLVSAWGLRSHRDLSIASQSPCKCNNYDCGCCEHIDWSPIGLHGTACTNFSYLPNDYGVSVTVTWNTYTLFNETISARNPPPFCFGIPELEKIRADICVRLYDLTFGENFHGCGKLSISVYHVIHRSVYLGCFNIPSALLTKAQTTESRMFNVIRDRLEKLEYWKKSLPEVNMI